MEASAYRAEEPVFSWSVYCGMPALGKLARVPHHMLFYDCDAIVEAHRLQRPLRPEGEYIHQNRERTKRSFARG